MTPASMLILVDTPKKPRQNFWILTRLIPRRLVNDEQGTFSLSQMSRTELTRVMPWRENEG